MRERISRTLRTPQTEPLIIRMPSGIFRRFANLEGQPGLQVDRISPRSLLRERLGCAIPLWLTDAMAVALLAVESSAEALRVLPTGDAVDRLLGQLDSRLAGAPDLATMLRVLCALAPDVREILTQAEIRERLKERFTNLGLVRADEVLGLFFDASHDPDAVCLVLARACIRDRLEALSLRDDLSPATALPPRLCSQALARQLPTLPIMEEDAAPFPVYLYHLLVLAERRTHKGGMPVERLADYVLQDWPGLIDALQMLFEQNPAIASEPLILALRQLNNEMAHDLAVRLREYLDHKHCDPLPLNAAVKDVLRWSERYFHYARGAFDRLDEPDDRICQDFARWVVREQHRIIQSDYDWRQVARTVEELLASDHVVILCVIDALSAIHLDLMELELRQCLVDQATPVIKPLFAPLPTITEVGKIGVLTGNEPVNQVTDYEKALLERFGAYVEADSLQIVRSWKEFRQSLRPATRLLVCLDNRVDDDLHQCTDYRHHRERVRTVGKQTAELIAQWQIDAARYHKQSAILITADHGATKISRLATPLPGTQAVERRLLRIETAPETESKDFAYVISRATGYLIPYSRVAFGSTATLLHGGLTPEEVLIPFILILPGNQGAVFGLQLTSVETHCPAATQGWYVRLSLSNTNRETFFNLKVVAKTPFIGESPVIARLEPHAKNQEIVFNLRSNIEQQGRTQVSFDLRYTNGRSEGYHRISFSLDLDLAGHLMERTEAANEFDDSFDL
ncbi:hypothetical protein [Thiocapsa marina]|uniref:PglZ domain protein n=1 Tax=Thiocapsa marina 5811 TaxID=768671 RepID=F9UG08_9GAMM|nr:hypothetical protein [Thiocapsa marina]EGV17032.1 PglZ domain protein [Thiocapsa marina 5811]